MHIKPAPHRRGHWFKSIVCKGFFTPQWLILIIIIIVIIIYLFASHLLLQTLHHGGQVGQPVLLALLHLQLELLLGHSAEVAVLLHGLEEHVALVLPLLGQHAQHLGLLGLQRVEERWGVAGGGGGG